MKYATQLQLLSKKFLSVQNALFAGNKAKERFVRNLADFAETWQMKE